MGSGSWRKRCPSLAVRVVSCVSGAVRASHMPATPQGLLLCSYTAAGIHSHAHQQRSQAALQPAWLVAWGGCVLQQSSASSKLHCSQDYPTAHRCSFATGCMQRGVPVQVEAAQLESLALHNTVDEAEASRQRTEVLTHQRQACVALCHRQDFMALHVHCPSEHH